MSNEQATPKKPKKKIGEIVNIVINVILIFAIILAALCTYVSFVSTSGNGVPNLFGFEVFSVQTDSMYPQLKAGDLVIDRTIQDTSTLEVGDIITYWTVINGERALNTHRINAIYDGGGYLIFETKGDKNSEADSLTVHESEVVGKYAGQIGGLGKVLDYLQTSTGFLIVIVIPVALFFLYHLIQFFRVLFEYQNIKTRLKIEEEQAMQAGAAAAPQQEPVKDKAAIEAELREQLKAEMMAEMLAQMKKQAQAEAAAAAAPIEAPAEEVPAEKAAPSETPAEAEPAEAPTEEVLVEDAPADESTEEAPAEEVPAEETPAEESAQETKE